MKCKQCENTRTAMSVFFRLYLFTLKQQQKALQRIRQTMRKSEEEERIDTGEVLEVLEGIVQDLSLKDKHKALL